MFFNHDEIHRQNYLSFSTFSHLPETPRLDLLFEGRAITLNPKDRPRIATTTTTNTTTTTTSTTSVYMKQALSVTNVVIIIFFSCPGRVRVAGESGTGSRARTQWGP